MNQIPQMTSMTDLVRNPREIVGLLGNGPVVIATSSKPTAVLVSADEWNKTAERLRYLERMVIGDAAIQADQWVNSADVDAGFKALGIG